eukprot:CAMPEP_0196786152 /NCGR_PEP_ID=MMETSP1104-20130614/20788_1 /TAXON_ID=33652 /ORGANISM="Cafeteria sp., Strain Caron Lab Isolate" /LENGTH=59 /DNA_ID=CAMNT_0042156465 /DNA_START=62 /DNA_END=241 /DNA_ORIENTATION=+
MKRTRASTSGADTSCRNRASVERHRGLSGGHAGGMEATESSTAAGDGHKEMGRWDAEAS